MEPSTVCWGYIGTMETDSDEVKVYWHPLGFRVI